MRGVNTLSWVSKNRLRTKKRMLPPRQKRVLPRSKGNATYLINSAVTSSLGIKNGEGWLVVSRQYICVWLTRSDIFHCFYFLDTRLLHVEGKKPDRAKWYCDPTSSLSARLVLDKKQCRFWTKRRARRQCTVWLMSDFGPRRLAFGRIPA